MSHSLSINGQLIAVDVLERKGEHIRFIYNDVEYCFSGHRCADGSFVLGGEVGYASPAGRSGTRLQLGKQEALISEATTDAAQESGQGRLSPLAPMPGMVRQLLVTAGQKVTNGQPLVVVEAMKLQLTLSAGGDAMVTNILVAEGQMVAEGAELVTLTPIES
jgi:biotin carboxyl carrier protein